jgi:peptide/nickel transport system permease protein
VIRLIFGRLVAAIVLVFLVSVLAFGISELGPDPAVTAAGPGAFPEDIVAARERLGLAGSAPQRYLDWISGAVRGDLGRSLLTTQPIQELLGQRTPVTLTIALAGIVVSAILGITLGILSAARPGGSLDRVVRFLVSIALATPPFWFASVLVLIFALRLGWLPATGWTPFSVSPTQWLRSLVLPALAVSLFGFAAITRTARTAALGVLSQDFIRSAKMKGLTGSEILRRHVLRNTLTTVLPILGVQFIVMFGAAAIIENVLALPGLGQAIVSAGSSGDTPIIQGVALAVAVLVAITNLIIDVLQGLLNPKTRS